MKDMCRVCGKSYHDSDLFKTPGANPICEKCFYNKYEVKA